MDDRLIEKLEGIETSFDEVIAQMSDPAVIADGSKYQELMIRHGELKPVVETFRRYREAESEIDEAELMAKDEQDGEMRDYLQTVAKERREEIERLDLELRRMLVPKDPDADKDVIVELRAAAGGEEAGLWAGDLYRMFERYAERHRWKVEPINVSWADGGGLSFGQFSVKGRGAYSRFKWEAGPHRVQRVPKTESQGRVHTSIATVAVLPEVEEVEVHINDSDLEIETMRSQGPGGQSVNTTDSAVRITHKPTGIVVSCQDEKSQLQNKLKAMRVLRARLYQQQMAEQLGERSDARRAQVGSGERAEKIRTYNFKENRVTDHRLGLTLHSLVNILDGDLDEFHDGLAAQEAAELLAEA
ncbi:MAG: peptide chain release factor 1 [Acidimicrobiia bacterium]|nr:peptide chain release factor 1 [Acidimicrobiia bacterium]